MPRYDLALSDKRETRHESRIFHSSEIFQLKRLSVWDYYAETWKYVEVLRRFSWYYVALRKFDLKKKEKTSLLFFCGVDEKLASRYSLFFITRYNLDHFDHTP